MPLINYIEPNGAIREIEVESGTSLMQGAVDNMVEGILAECGGGCSCATCHVYIDAAWMAQVGEATDVEKEMLSCTPDPQPSSRLSCQVTITDELDGLIVRIPAAQY